MKVISLQAFEEMDRLQIALEETSLILSLFFPGFRFLWMLLWFLPFCRQCFSVRFVLRLSLYSVSCVMSERGVSSCVMSTDPVEAD